MHGKPSLRSVLPMLVVLLVPQADALAAMPRPFDSPGFLVDAASLGQEIEVGDFDGDGHEDLAFFDYPAGVPYTDPRVRIRFGPLAGSIGPESSILLGELNTSGTGGFLFSGEMTGDAVRDLYFVPIGEGQTVRVGPGRVLQAVGFPTYFLSLPFGLGDLDLDGTADILTGGESYHRVALNDGAGHVDFGPEVGNPTPPMYGSPLADFDDDDVLDYVGAWASELSIARGLAGAQFQQHWITAPLPSAPTNVLATDIDTDGDPDIVVLHTFGNQAQVFRNDGGTYFTALAAVPTGMGANRLRAFDANADGALDLACAVRGGTEVAFLFGDGAGGFAAPALVRAGLFVRDLDAIDVDGDGWRDLLVAAEYGATTIAIRSGSTPGAYALRVPGGVAPRRLRVADANGDGRRDLVVLRTSPSVVTIQAARPGYAGWTRSDLDVEAAPRDLELVDLDRDGALDLVTAHGTSSLSLRRGLGGGTFAAPVFLATPPQAQHVRAADFDEDGEIDLVVACEGGTAFRTWRGLGSFSFGAGVDVVSSAGSGGIAELLAVDVTLDARPDLVALNRTGVVYVHRGLPGGVFAAAETYPVGAVANGIDFGDLDGDGIPDLVVAREGDEAIVRFRGVGNGTFVSGPRLDPGTDARAVRLADLDGDGRLDVTALLDDSHVTPTVGTVASLRSLGGGTFELPVGLLAGLDPRLLVVGDVTGDGRPDAIVASPTDTVLTILRNLSAGPVAVENTPRAAGALRVTVTPTPAFGLFHVELRGGPATRARVELYDLRGRRVSVPMEATLDAGGFARVAPRLEHRPAGVYFVRVTVGDEVSIARAVVLP